MKLVKNMATTMLILSMTSAQFASASINANVSAVDSAIKEYNKAVDSGIPIEVANKTFATRVVDNGLTPYDMSAWVQQNSSPKNYLGFQKAFTYSMDQAQGTAMSDAQIQSALGIGLNATMQEGVHWRSCALKVTAESILFVAAGTLGIISLSYLHMDHGQNGNITNAQAEDQATKSSNASTYQTAAPNALANMNKDQVSINADNAAIATINAQISSAPSSQLASLEAQLSSAEKQLSTDQAGLTADTNAYQQALSTYTSIWLKNQDADADNQMNNQIAGYQTTQLHDRKVAEITGILTGVLGAAGTLSAIAHCQE